MLKTFIGFKRTDLWVYNNSICIIMRPMWAKIQFSTSRKTGVDWGRLLGYKPLKCDGSGCGHLPNVHAEWTSHSCILIAYYFSMAPR